MRSKTSDSYWLEYQLIYLFPMYWHSFQAEVKFLKGTRFLCIEIVIFIEYTNGYYFDEPLFIGHFSGKKALSYWRKWCLVYIQGHGGHGSSLYHVTNKFWWYREKSTVNFFASGNRERKQRNVLERWKGRIYVGSHKAKGGHKRSYSIKWAKEIRREKSPLSSDLHHIASPSAGFA